MIASLMMYLLPELEGAYDRYWRLICQNLQKHGIDFPRQLSQTAEEFSVWTDRSLVLSQTCGMPFRNSLKDKVQIVGTPDYGLDGCPPGYYRSAIVVHADDCRKELTDFDDAIMAFNQEHSQSGFAAAYSHFEPLDVCFREWLRTGSHFQSAQAIVDKRADLAAIDVVTLDLLKQYSPLFEHLRIVGYTEPTPGQLYITAKGQDATAIRNACDRALSALKAKDLLQLRLHGIVSVPREKYLAVSNPPDGLWKRGVTAGLRYANASK